MNNFKSGMKNTKKARFVNQLNFLSEKEREEIIAFFSTYPVYESLIDWNNKSLSYNDFEKVFEKAKNSNRNRKLEMIIKPELLFEGYNCRIISNTENFLVVMPLDWKCAVFMNSFKCGGIGAQWCIGDKNSADSWEKYNSDCLFCLIYFKRKHPVFNRKIMLQYDTNVKELLFFTETDDGIDFYEYFSDYSNINKNKRWYYYLMYQKKIHNQLFFEFDIFNNIELSEENILNISLLDLVNEKIMDVF